MANEFNVLRYAKATYDVAVHGGAVADAVGLGIVIPAGAIVLNVIGSAVTAFTSTGAATIAINLGATEVNAATAYNHGDYSGVDVHFNTATKLTADSEINVDIAGEVLATGKYDIYVEYIF